MSVINQARSGGEVRIGSDYRVDSIAFYGSPATDGPDSPCVYLHITAIDGTEIHRRLTVAEAREIRLMVGIAIDAASTKDE